MNLKKQAVLSVFLFASTMISVPALAEENMFNIKFNWTAIDFDVGVADAITIGPSVGFNYVSDASHSLKVLKFGIRSNYFFSGKLFTDSFYVGPWINYGFGSVSGSGSSISNNFITVGTNIGYQWVWSSGFNFSLGGGICYMNPRTDVGITPGLHGNGLNPTLELALGYLF